MALDVMNATTYQNNISPAKKVSNVGGSTNVDMNFDFLRKQQTQKFQPAVEQEGDSKETPASEHIKAEISKANGRLKHINTKCEFSYHEETRRISITVKDKDTEEIIREIPPEKTLEMIEKMWELAGFLIDEKR